jgi:hypothetical protein
MNKVSAGEGGADPNVGMPRWVKISGLIAAAVIVLLVAAVLFGGGQHGPARHLGGLSVLVPVMTNGMTAP